MISFLALALLFGISAAKLAETETGARCVFPFKYYGETFDSCTKFKSNKLWCATKVSDDDEYVPGSRHWAYCCPNPAKCKLNCDELGGFKMHENCQLCECEAKNPCTSGTSPCGGTSKCEVKNKEAVCRCPTNEIYDETAKSCKVVNPCLSSKNPCGSGSCNFKDGKAVCGCKSGFTFDEKTKSCQKSLVDTNSDCKQWAYDGQCKVNPKYMLVSCARSCQICEAGGMDCSIKRCSYYASFGDCDKFPNMMIYCKKACEEKAAETLVDRNSNCKQWAYDGQCKVNPKYMLVFCAKSCKICADEIMDCSIKRCSYYASFGDCDKFPNMNIYCKKTCEERAASKFRDDNKSCPKWAKDGQCIINPNYMLPYCALSCYKCKIGEWDCSIKNCAYYASFGDCRKFPRMLTYCKSACT